MVAAESTPREPSLERHADADVEGVANARVGSQVCPSLGSESIRVEKFESVRESLRMLPQDCGSASPHGARILREIHTAAAAFGIQVTL